jgi:prephenate dehydrogenase
MNFAILGYGRFGRAFAELLLQAGHHVHVCDPHADIPAGLAAGSLADAVDAAQWIVLAMPVPHMRDALQALRPLLHAGQVVLDVGSVKMHPCAAMDECLGAEIAHVGTHPLFGPISLARGDRPLRTVICASERHPQTATRARQLFVDLGCEVIDQSPAAHDRAMASTHALAFFIAKGLVDMGISEDLTWAPPSFQGLQNMLAAVRGDAGHLFSAIQQENPFATEARAQLLASLAHIHDQLLDNSNDDALDIPGLPTDS